MVAGEVRSLALRAAEAGRNTSAMIAGTEKQIKAGAAVARQTNESFAAVSKRTVKVATLVSEIAKASEEQAKGILQINQAVTEMGNITQRNAASAEETASAAQDMTELAARVQGVVDDLAVLVAGVRSAAQSSGGEVPPKSSREKSGGRTVRALPSPGARQETARTEPFSSF